MGGRERYRVIVTHHEKYMAVVNAGSKTEARDITLRMTKDRGTMFPPGVKVYPDSKPNKVQKLPDDDKWCVDSVELAPPPASDIYARYRCAATRCW